MALARSIEQSAVLAGWESPWPIQQNLSGLVTGIVVEPNTREGKALKVAIETISRLRITLSTSPPRPEDKGALSVWIGVKDQ